MTSSNLTSTQQRHDVLRHTFSPASGKVIMTAGIIALPDAIRNEIMLKVRTFDQWNDGNDPHQEHDLGAFWYAGYHVFWKIDDYQGEDDLGLVLTIMLSEEY